MTKPEEQYLSYLLRLWQSQRNGEFVWRASLESSQTGQQWVFANLDDCFAFLQEQGKILSESDQNTVSKHKGGQHMI